MAGSTWRTVALNGTKHVINGSIKAMSSQTLPRQSTLSMNSEASLKSSINLSHSLAKSVSITANQQLPTMPNLPPLAVLPLSSVVRSLTVTTISCSPLLLRPSLAIMTKLAHSQSALLNPDQNPILRWLLKKTFYAQFCAGENAREVQRTIKRLKGLGYRGVILGYAREVVMEGKETDEFQTESKRQISEASLKNEVLPWKNGSLETVRLAERGDFVALKFTGAGSQALYELAHDMDPSPALAEAIDSMCELAASRGVKLVFDAEQQAVQKGIDSWTLRYMERYNRQPSAEAVVYGTYQAYLKATPRILARHLAISQRRGFTLGVKLVRGAYLGSDPRHLINDTKQETDRAYDGITESLLRRRYGRVLKADGSADGALFPRADVILASHNHTTVRRARELQRAQAERNEERTEVIYAQLQGMADEVSCELVQACEKAKSSGMDGGSGSGGNEVSDPIDVPRAYKYLVWGTTGECMKYLLRRAQENKDAVQRTREGRDAMASELARRMKRALGLSA